MQFFALDRPILLEVSGKDAPRYLNARLTNDARIVSDARGVLAAALTPQGKTEGLFVVMKRSSDRYLLLCDGGERSEVVAAFKRYLVADRVTVDDISDDYEAVHLLSPSTPPGEGEVDLLSAPPLEYRLVEGGAAIRRTRTREAGIDLVLPKGAVRRFTEGGVELGDGQRVYERIVAGAPEFPFEINSDTLFSESGLLEAISFKKGCYVGQEVIERVDALGKLPRKLMRVRFRLPAEVAVGKEVTLRDREPARLGKIVTVGSNNEEAVAFAALKPDTESGTLVRTGEAEGVVF
jgi:folate-binding protein YgfZ